MSKNQKIFLFILGFYVILDFVLSNLIGIFIWDKTNSTESMLIYYISMFASLLVVSQLTAWIVGKIGAKRVYSLSIVGAIAQAFFLGFAQNNLSSLLVPAAIISGISIGLQSISYNVIVSAITEGGVPTTFFGFKSSIMNLTTILVVPLITYLISASGSYNVSYIFAILSGIAILILINFVHTSDLPHEYHPLRLLKSLRQDTDGKIYLTTRFLFGIYNGLSWAILGVVTYRFVGSVIIWGIVSTLFTIINIIGSYFYGRLKSVNTPKLLSVFSTLIFGLVVIVLSTNWSLPSFVIYQVALILLNIGFSIYYEKVMFDIVSEEKFLVDNSQELLGVGEVMIGVGRIIPLGILLYLNFSLDQELMLRILFLAIASIPLLIISELKNTLSFQRRSAILG